MNKGWIWISNGRFTVRFEIEKGKVAQAPNLFKRFKGRTWKEVVRFMDHFYKNVNIEFFEED